MTMKTRLALAALPFLALAAPADAHRQWLLPSATSMSGSGDWVTVDAAVSNDVFYFEHQPMRLNNIVITAPDGTTVAPANPSTGRYRSTFDVELKQPGTWRIANVNQGVNASWTEGGEVKRWRGSADEAAKNIPANAADLRVTENAGRVETFVTEKAPTPIKPIGKGLEMVPVTHPSDLVNGEAATFQMMLDGKPAAGLDVEVIPGGVRHRDKLNDIKAKTGADGKFTVKWTQAGFWWISTSTGGGPRGEGGPGGGMGRPGGAGAAPAEGARPAPPPPSGPLGRSKRASYVATLEVMPQ
jgi:uncharacterized GH25 family protein